MHQKKKGVQQTQNEEEGKDDVEPTRSEAEDQRQQNRQSFISGVHDITHVVVRTAQEAAAREVKTKTSASGDVRTHQNPGPLQKHRLSHVQPDTRGTFKASRNSDGCNYQVQPDRLMRQALSISFHDKTPADRAELRATMSMSGVFDFHHFAKEDGEGTATSGDTQEESTEESGEHSHRVSQSKENGKADGRFLPSNGPDVQHEDEEMGPEVPAVEEVLTPVYVHEMPEFEIIEEEEWAEDEEDDEFYPKLRAVVGLATPSVVCTVASFAREIINLYYITSMGDFRLLSALGLGNIIVNTFVIAIGLSLSASMENLVSQALATGKLQMCGHHLNRSMIFWTVTFLALSPLLLYSKTLLTAIGQDPEISAIAEQYLICYMPALFLWVLCDMYRRFFNCFYHTKTPMLCFLASLAIHPFVAHLLVVKHGMQLQGIAAASLVSNGLTYILLRVMLSRHGDMHQANISPSLQTITGVRVYFETALPTIFVMVLDRFAWEQLTLASGLIGMKEQASQVILIYLMSLCSMAGYGMQSPSNALIGGEMVQANVDRARTHFRTISSLFLMLIIGQCMAFYLSEQSILAKLLGTGSESLAQQNSEKHNQDVPFTTEELQASIHSVYFMVLLNILPDSMRGMLFGALQALGLQSRLTRYHVWLQCLALPALLYLFAFKYCTNKLLGVWIAKTIVDSAIFLLYYIEIKMANWHAIAEEAGRRTALASKKHQVSSWCMINPRMRQEATGYPASAGQDPSSELQQF